MGKQLVLIDGSSYFYRAFFAIRGISNSKGMPTNAAYGFTNMLVKIMNQFANAHLAVVFDAGEKTFRNEIYEDYKANRDAMPEDLSVQIPYIKRIPEAYNLPTLQVDGWEADDIIGTLAEQAHKKGFEVIIVAADKDFMQLVTKSDKPDGKPGIVMYDDRDDTYVGKERVKDKFGVRPDQVIDVLAIMGDSSDNVPGVRGIGPKGASALIGKFGSLKGVYQNLAKVEKERMRTLLQEGRKSAEMSHVLVTISLKAPVKFSVREFARRDPDKEKLAELFRELEFKRFLKEVAPDEIVPRQQGISYELYRCITEKADLEKIVQKLKKAKRLSLDTETDGLNPMRANLVGISLAAKPGEGIYIPVGHRYLGAPPQIPIDTVRKILGPVLKDPKVPKVGQNLKYDIVVLARHEMPVNGVVFDTLLASYVIEPEAPSHKLDALSKQYLQHDMIPFTDVVGKGKKQITFDYVNVDLATEYAAEDADVALRLEPLMARRLDEDKLRGLFDDVEIPLMSLLARTEMNGVAIDVKSLQKMSREFAGELRKIVAAARKIVGREFNLDSPKQLQEILFTQLKLPPQKHTKTGYSTDASVLEKLKEMHPLPKKIVEYRTLSKLKSTYVDALPRLVHPKTGRIHTSYNQAVAATGRLSSSDPNLQNIPVRGEAGRRIRRAFIAPKGCILISADYSQIELRVLAHLADDSALIKLFRGNEDIHDATAREIFGAQKVTADMRRKAKEVNFGIVYGLSAFGLSERIGVPVREARDFIERTFARYTGVQKFIKSLVEGARKNGYVSTILGRRRYIRDINSRNGMLRQAAERVAVNAPIQGSAADIMKIAMIDVGQAMDKAKLKSLLIMQVHDELVVEATKAEAGKVSRILREGMEGAYKLNVPITVDLSEGANWADAKG